MSTANNTFLKNIICPVCGNNFKAIAVKVNAPRIVSKDSDFFIRYSVVNSYFYDVIICDECGYSSMKSEFDKIKSYQTDLIKTNLTPKWKHKAFPDNFNEKIAIERYKLALLTSVITNSKTSTKSMICLKTAWMYRLLEDTKNENILLGQALEGFKEVFFNESLPIYGLDKFTIMYLIGELSRRLDKNDDAMNWYSKAIVSIGAPHKIKELCRDGRDKIKIPVQV